MDNKRFSILRFSEELGVLQPSQDDRMVFPVLKGDVIQFQVAASDTAVFSSVGFYSPVLGVVGLDYTFTNLDEKTSLIKAEFTGFTFPISDYDWLRNGCFRLFIVMIDKGFPVNYVSNFLLSPALYENHSILLRYSNNEDIGGFAYPSAGAYQQLRVFGDLLYVQFENERETYKKSNGVIEVLSAKVNLERELYTGVYKSYFHQGLNFALNHDTVSINGEGVVLKDYGSIEYIEEYESRDFGSAKIKVLSTPYGVMNPSFL